MVVVDQLAPIGTLAIAVARSRGMAVAYLPGLAMRRIAGLSGGRPRQTPVTRMSSPMPHAPCPTPFAGSGRTGRPPSNSASWLATTRTSPPSRPGWPTAYTTHCSTSIQPWNACWASTLAYLARSKGQSRSHTESDLRSFVAWFQGRALDPRDARRTHNELYLRWMQEVARYKALDAVTPPLRGHGLLPDPCLRRCPSELACRVRPSAEGAE